MFGGNAAGFYRPILRDLEFNLWYRSRGDVYVIRRGSYDIRSSYMDFERNDVVTLSINRIVVVPLGARYVI